MGSRLDWQTKHLNELLVEMIREEIGPEWAAQIRARLQPRVDPCSPPLVLRPGMWLNYRRDADDCGRIEVIEYGGITCRIFKIGQQRPIKLATRKLLGCKEVIPPDPRRPVPRWIQPGAHFMDAFDNRWVIRTLSKGMCSARRGDGLFAFWFTDELCGTTIRPILTAWERLDEEAV